MYNVLKNKTYCHFPKMFLLNKEIAEPLLFGHKKQRVKINLNIYKNGLNPTEQHWRVDTAWP